VFEAMPAWSCLTCGNQHADTPQPPGSCAICTDERQWVPPSGQRWATISDLAATGHRSDVRSLEPGLLGVGATPDVAIGQRAVVVQTGAGNVMWDTPGFIDDEAISAVRDIGGLTAITASHPHFYGTIVEWAHVFDAAILVPEADQEWLMRPDPAVRLWKDRLEVAPGVTLIQCGGHFDGSAVLHWTDGADGRGVLLAGDTIMVTPGEDRVTFLRSAPNRLPLPRSSVERVTAAIEDLEYDRIYSGWWGPTVHGGGRDIVRRSAARYIQWLTGDALRNE
jgi:Metallo-beta-lactamase superfamily